MDRFTGIHAVREALEAGGTFDRIVIAKGRQDSRIEEIVQLARQHAIASPTRATIRAWLPSPPRAPPPP
jgi:tRNA G18 (ribose-2'-O)-methylase SpoU